MSLAKDYVAEIRLGGENKCKTPQCVRKCHKDHCVFCINKMLLEQGVKPETMRACSIVFHKIGSHNEEPFAINKAIAAIEREIK